LARLLAYLGRKPVVKIIGVSMRSPSRERTRKALSEAPHCGDPKIAKFLLQIFGRCPFLDEPVARAGIST
jgi:hypothetical protein